MSIARQAAYPKSTLCRFLDARLPQRRLVVDDWAPACPSHVNGRVVPSVD